MILKLDASKSVGMRLIRFECVFSLLSLRNLVCFVFVFVFSVKVRGVIC